MRQIGITPNPNQPNSSYFVQNFGGGNTGKFVAYPDPVSGAQGMVNFLKYNGSINALNTAINTPGANPVQAYVNYLQQTRYMGGVGLVDQSGHVVTQKQYDDYAAAISSIVQSLSQVKPVPPGTSDQEFGSSAIQASMIPDPATQSVSSTTIMANGLNLTDPTGTDPLADTYQRQVSVVDGSRVLATQQQSNFLSQQIALIQQMPALMMLVNPSEFNRAYEHTTDPVKTRSGYVVNIWLEKPTVITAKGVTAGQYVFAADGSGGLSALNRIQSVSYQNLMSLVSMFKNNGNIFTDNTFGDGNTGIPLISLSLFIYYDNHIYIGSFDDFDITDDGNKPYNLSYSWKFTVRYDIDTTQMSGSTVTNPGLSIGVSPAVVNGILGSS